MPETNAETRAAHIKAIRHFNRIYTQRIRLLDEQMPHSSLSLPEARVLLEVAHRTSANGASLARALDLDPGYVSRILTRLQHNELLRRSRSTTDRRAHEYALSSLGQQTLDELAKTAQTQIDALLDELGHEAEIEFVHAVGVLQRTLSDQTEAAGSAQPFVLRQHEPGDMGWIVQRHAQLYQQEYGFDAAFEALCARIAAEFLDNFDTDKERCWIAERDDQPLGSALVVNAGNGSAQIRLVLIEPRARGFGLGRRLIRECVRFATRKKYQRITLWTNANLTAARHIYASEGFELISSESHQSFGHNLVGEHWRKNL